MTLEALKLSLIEKLMKIHDKSVIQRIFKEIDRENTKTDKPWMKFAGTLDAKDAKKR